MLYFDVKVKSYFVNLVLKRFFCLDCQDSNENCEVWKEQGYCETSDFPYLQEICRKSCEVCKACSEEELSTAVPLGESEESEILTE